MAKRIVILGGGPGGLVAANYLAKRLGRGEAEIVLVDKTGYHLFPPSLLWVMVGHREPDEIRRPLEPLARKGVRVVVDSVEAIDPDNGEVILSSGSLSYDYLIVALGSDPREDLVPGSSRNACSPWTIEGALRCRELLAGFTRGRVVVGPVEWPYKCPPAPFEAAFMVKYLVDEVRGGSAEVSVFHMWREPMEPFGPFMVDAFRGFLEMYGVGFRGGVEVERIEEGRVVFKNGEYIGYDLAIVVPPHRPPRAVAESKLSNPEVGGYMLVDKRTLRHPEYPNVFGVGDIIAPTLGLGMAGIFAHFQAEFVSSQIIDEIKGSYMGEDYNKSGVCVMDLGYSGAAVYCDFSGKLEGRSQYPDCVILGGMKAFRLVKYAFERMWFEKYLG